MPRNSGNLVIPTNAELHLIQQAYIHDQELKDPIFKLFPIVKYQEARVKWEIRDNFYGLQFGRGFNGSPGVVSNVGGKRWEAVPSVHGDRIVVDEEEITNRAIYGTWHKPAEIGDLVAQAQLLANARMLDRIRYNLYQLLQFGVYSVYSKGGVLVGQDRAGVTSITPSIPWSTLDTSTPLADLRAALLQGRGFSVDFAKGELLMNRKVLNYLLNNNNPADLGGRKGLYGITGNLSLDQLNQILISNDLPPVTVNEQGYFDSTGTFNLFIADNMALMVGKRPDDSPLGEYQLTRNANNPNGEPDPYVIVTDSLEVTGNPVPRTIAVDCGHNGGPAIYYSKGVLAFTVA